MEEINEMAVSELQLDKSNWSLTKFGDVAIQQKQSVDRENTGLTRYVKGEHMGSEDLHLREWGELTDEYLGPAFIRKFEEGDILYGSRRTYLRKVVLAPFSGITSNTTFVIKANEKRIDKRLLPFVMMSEGFTENSIRNSKGSVNPYINWKDIANYEFLLPPKDQQAQLAELLWALDDVIEREKEVEEKFQRTLFSSLKEIFQKTEKRKKLIELCKDQPKYGANSPAIEYDNQIRYLRITDIGEFGELNAEKVSAENHEDKYILNYGDFLLARTADPGRAYFYKDKDGLCSHAGYLIKFPLDQTKILPEYLYYFTQTSEFKTWINQTTRKGTISNINANEFSRVMIPVTSISNQKKIISEISRLYKMLRDVSEKKSSSQSLQKSLINQIF